MIATIASSPVCYARDISFSWTANTEEIDGYKLYILAGPTGGITKTNATEIIALDQTTSYTCQGLDDNQAYHFALTAFRNIDNLESDFSAEITLLPVDTPPVDVAPPADTDPTADISDFNQLEVVGYSYQDLEGTVTIEDNGATLALAGNRWVKTVQYYDITPETVIEFDFNSTIEGEIHGVGFDEDDELTNDKRIFQLFGTSMWTSAIQNDPRYLQSDLGNWVHFVIPVGQYYTGNNMNLVFVNDHDNAPANGTGRFSNVKVHEGSVTPPSAPPAPSPSGLIIDNGDSETSFTGTWLADGGNDYYGTQSVYSRTTPGSTYRYEASLDGQYELSLWWTEYYNQWTNRCTDVSVEIYDGSTLIDTLIVNQQENGGQWNPQGSYTFSGTGSVVIVSQGDACTTNADAIQFISNNLPADIQPPAPPAPPAPSPSGLIIDNGDSETSFTGTWLADGGNDYYGTQSVYSRTTPGSTYRYEASLDGQYELSLWWTEYYNQWTNRCRDVSVEIYDGSTLVDTLIVNQQENGGQWNPQGSYTFSGTGSVVIVSQGDACTTNADAVRFISSDLPADILPPAPPASSLTELIIDNGDLETSFTGTWLADSGKDYYGTQSVYSRTTPGSTYRYEASLDGQYELSLWWTEYYNQWTNRCTDVSVEVYNGSTLLNTLIVNQQINGGQWNPQGSYTFTGTGSVVIVSQGDACTTNADAVRFSEVAL